MFFQRIIQFLGIFRSKIKIRSYLSKVSKNYYYGLLQCIFWFLVLQFVLEVFGVKIKFNVLIPLITANIYFGFLIKRYFNVEEIKIIRKLTMLSCLIIAFIFIFMGFNWYKEDYYAIIYTFPYKVLMYFKETEGGIIEKVGIVKTLKSRYFLYALIVNAGFYLGTLKINNKNNRGNCVENQIDGDS